MIEKLVKLPGASSAMTVLVEEEKPFPGSLRFMGSVDETSNLPNYTSDKESHLGEFFLVASNSSEYVYTKALENEEYVYYWEELGSVIDLTPYAPLASPVFTGAPKGPTPTSESDDTALATKKYVDDSTPDLTPYATTDDLNNKVDKVTGKGLSTEDFTTAEKTKLEGVEAGAQANPDLESSIGQSTSAAMTQKAVTDSLYDWQEGDITQWSAISFPNNTKSYSYLAYGNGIFIALVGGSETNKAAKSIDGINWEEITLPISAYWSGCNYLDNKFIILESWGRCYSSEDGITWTSMGVTSTGAESIAFGNNIYVATCGGGSSPRIASRINDQWNYTDVLSWKPGVIVYGNGKFVIIPYSSVTSDKGAYSIDGINWEEITLPRSQEWQSLIYAGDKFVALGYSDKGAYSIDGINWIETTLPRSSVWRAIAYGDGKYIAGASSSDFPYLYSNDGINWTWFRGTQMCVAIAYGDGVFVEASGKVGGTGSYAISFTKTPKFALLDSPSFTGSPTAPTPTAQSDDTAIATKKYVDDAIAAAIAALS